MKFQLNWLYWRNLLLQSFIGGIVLIALLILTAALFGNYFNAPPIRVTNLEPVLGVLCPGQSVPVHNQIEVTHSSLLFYYVSTADERALSNYFGTQSAYIGLPHPFPGAFEQFVPWTVPNLPPGKYTRIFSVHGVDGDVKAVTVISDYTIAPSCDALGE